MEMALRTFGRRREDTRYMFLASKNREFRLWQELSFHKPLSKDFLFHERFRTEERWFGAVTNKDAYFGLRLRERLTVTKSLTQTWSLEFGDEYLRMLSDKKFLFNANRILLLA